MTFTGSGWTNQQLDLLREMHGNFRSARAIGNAVGKSRGEVAAMIQHLHLPSHGHSWPRQSTKRQVAVPRPIPNVASSLHPVPFLEVLKHHCRAILDQRDAKGGVLFCGVHKDGDSSYCAEHRARFTRLTYATGED